jgi:hypothetical protein
MHRWSVQEIAGLTLPRDLGTLRLAQCSAACSPRLPGVVHSTSSRVAHGPLGGVERRGRKVRFARLIHRPVRVLGEPAVRAACGGNLSLP